MLLDMRLFEHADFEQAMLRAMEHFLSHGLCVAIIEMDYCVTESLFISVWQRGDACVRRSKKPHLQRQNRLPAFGRLFPDWI